MSHMQVSLWLRATDGVLAGSTGSRSGRWGNHHPKTEKHKPHLLRLITRSWVYFGLQHRGSARCLLDREKKIVISTSLPGQVCHLEPLITPSCLNTQCSISVLMVFNIQDGPMLMAVVKRRPPLYDRGVLSLKHSWPEPFNLPIQVVLMFNNQLWIVEGLHGALLWSTYASHSFTFNHYGGKPQRGCSSTGWQGVIPLCR